MGFPFPRLIGQVEVEERRPRYWNEPRRKRLNFVKSHNTKSKSDDWQLVPKAQQRPHSEQQKWDWHQQQAQMRFHGNDISKAQTLKIQEDQQVQAYLERMSRMAELHGHHALPPHMHAGHIEGHHGSDPDDEIVAIVSDSDDSSDDDDHHHHHHHHHVKHVKAAPKLIEATPKHIKLAKDHLPSSKKSKKDKDKKKGSGKKDKRSSSRHTTFLFGEIDTDSSDDSFAHAQRRMRSHSRGRSRSIPRIVTLDDSDSDRSYVYHLSPKHRGRR